MKIIHLILVIFVVVSSKTITVPTDSPDILSAVHGSKEGDTVFLKYGTYRESIVLPYGVSLIGENVDKTIIKGNGTNPVVKVANYSIVSNITISGGGIGVLSENTNAVIENCIVADNRETGIQCVVSLPTIRNNVIISNKWSGLYCELISYGNKSVIEHNVFIANGNSGIMLSKKSGVVVQNNVFLRNGQYGIYVSNDSRISRITYNDFYENRREYNGYAIIDGSNISEDPKIKLTRKTLFSGFVSSSERLLKRGKNNVRIGLLPQNEAEEFDKDSDGDKISNSEDACPNDPEDIDGFADEDGCPDIDNDNDGIKDEFDQCPSSPEDFDGFSDGDGCPDTDNDNDGINDEIDKCPSDKETHNGYRDEDGCPDTVENFKR